MSRQKSEVAERVGFAALRSLTTVQLGEKLAGPPHEAAQWLQLAARYGIVEAQTALAQILLEGRGIRRNHNAAARWFRIAAEAGYVPAINMLGRCYELGWGLPIDLPRAASCYRRAAEAGLDWGQYNYANLMLRGRGVSRDRKAALELYKRAADQGHAKSINMVGRFIEEGWETTPNPTAAAEWYRRSAANGDFRGQYNLASVLAVGGDIEEAEIWLHRAMQTATADFLKLMSSRLGGSPEPRLRRVAAEAALRAAAGIGPAPPDQHTR